MKREWGEKGVGRELDEHIGGGGKSGGGENGWDGRSTLNETRKKKGWVKIISG